MNSLAPPAHSSNLPGAWLLVVLLMPVALLNYLDRQMMAAMRESVMKSIPDPNVAAADPSDPTAPPRMLADAPNRDKLWGLMLGQFKWVYAAFSLIGGYLADRFSRRWTICLSLFVWSAVTWWTGHITSYEELLWARSCMGFSEAFYIPAALALIADHHVAGTRSRAIGLHQMAIYGGVIAGGFGGYLAEHPAVGWRMTFTSCGWFGMLYALPLLWLLRDVPRPTDPEDRQDLSIFAAYGGLLKTPAFLLLVLYFTLPAIAGWIIRDWMPAVLKDRFQIGEGLAGVSATLPWQLASILGAIGGGWLADLWMRRTIRGRIYVSAIGMSLIVPAIFGVGHAGSLTVAVTFLVLFGLGWGLFDGNNMPILSQIARPEYRATGYGIMNFVSISCGGLGDLGFGVLRDRNVPLDLIFGGFSAVAILSVILVLLIRPRPELSLTTNAA